MKFLIFLIIFLFQGQVAISQSAERIEPPFWWTGLRDPSLQLMLYGKDIGQLEVKIDARGIKLISKQQVNSPNYLFVDLEIAPECKPGSFEVILERNGKEASRFKYELMPREANSSKREGFNSSDVIYLITPDRFANANILNDNLPDLQDAVDRTKPLGRHGGDIAGVINHLDYIHEMGFTSIWLNPVLENNMPRHSYHGYAITDFYKVDPRFGTNVEYRALSKRASEKGIKLIKDMVINHCGLHHWWMNDLPTKDWINYQGEEYQQTNHIKTLNLDPYAASADKEVMMKGWFVPTMPDLNLKNPLLAKYMTQNTIWWIEYAGLAGVRMDTYPYPDETYMSHWSQSIMNEYPNFNITGEAWHDDPAVIAYWQRGKQNPNGYESSLPSVCDFPLQSALHKSLMAGKGWNDQWNLLYETLAKDFHYPDPNNLVVFADNHDMDRLFTQVQNDWAKFQMAMAYILTIRGIPQIYYGTEILMTNEGTDNHGVIRSDFPGGWDTDTVNVFLKKELSSSQMKSMDFLKKLMNWRKNSEAIHKGKTVHFAPKQNIYVFFRHTETQTVMVILNRNNEPITLSLDRFGENIPNNAIAKNVLTGADKMLGSEILLPEAGPVILEWNTGN